MKNVAAIVIAVAVVIFAFVLGNAYRYKFRQTERITVTGASEINFQADLIVWNASYSRNSSVLQDAFSVLKQDEQTVRGYLSQQGLNDTEIVYSAVNIEKLYNTTYDDNGRTTGSVFAGYRLTQTVKVESMNINKVDKISREITSLIQQGIELTSASPNYYYTKLGDLKIDLLAKASADGEKRAETIAKNAGQSLGGLKKASMGVFQITGQNENETYEYGGAFNTSNINKTATITVKMEFDVK
jgi:hypothetical protein